MICASCFADSAETAAFCTRCGLRFGPRSGAEPAQTAAAAAASARAIQAYQARAAAESQPRIATAAPFRDPRRLRTWVVIALVCLGAILLARAYQDIAQIRLVDALLSGGFASQLEAMQAVDTNDRRQEMLIAVYVAAFVVTMIAFSLWIYRVAGNARAISAQDFEVSPRMAVASNFIPILNFWLPYRAMSEIWRASRNPSSWRGDAPGAFFGWWWAIWVISFISGNFSFSITTRSKTLEDISWSTQLDFIWVALDFASVVMGVLLVIRLTAFQMQASSGEALHKVFE